MQVKVTPRASRNRIEAGEPLRVYVTAAPVDGGANAAVIELLSEFFGVPKSRVSIVGGHTSRTKSVQVEGLDDEQLLGRLE